jgi:hypothetical protein
MPPIIFPPSRKRRPPRGLDGNAFRARAEARTERQTSIRAGRFGRLNEAFKLSNLCPHDVTDRFGLVRPEPVLEIAVAIARRAARAFSPTVHPTPAPIPYCRLPAGATRACLCSAPGRLRQICQPSVNVFLTHGVVCHLLRHPLSLAFIDDANHPLGPRVYVNVSNLHCLRIPPSMPV